MQYPLQGDITTVEGAPSGSETGGNMDTDECWIRDAVESAALEKLRGVLSEEARSSDEMQSLVRSIGSEARCFLRYLRLHSVRLTDRQSSDCAYRRMMTD